jgi:predicted nucleic acid-binding protein
MTLYVETSALLSWLFGEPEGSKAAEAIDGASAVVSSKLTLLEAQRALVRAGSTNGLTEADQGKARRALEDTIGAWELMEITSEVYSRASRPFPTEPVRTLDAVHLSTMLVFVYLYRDLTVLTFDERIRRNAKGLGLLVL